MGSDNISINEYVTTDLTSNSCNYGFKIIGKHFSFNRIVNIWNSLADHIVNRNTIQSFYKKKKLDNYLVSVHQIEHFIPVNLTFSNSCRLLIF